MEQRLLTPGPTPLPPQVREALARPIIHHRTSQFQQVIKESEQGLKEIFQTKNDVFILASSGTGAMEAAVANLLSPGDKAITIQGGKFGERWTELCKAYKAVPIVVDVTWGKAIDPKLIAEKLAADKDIKAVFATLTETSTGVDTDIKALGEVVRNTSACLVVDAISGLGAVDIQTDNWGVDVVVSGSQKGLMLPPGLGLISVSPKAMKLVAESKSPRYYFDLKAAKKALDKTDTPWTPAIGLMIALNESINLMKKEGLQNIFKRCKLEGEAIRQAAKALGFTVFADPNCMSNAVTAINVPAGLDGELMVKTMKDKYGVTIAGGQAELKGKVFRAAHMGYINKEDIIFALSTMETVLDEMGYFTQHPDIKKGAGVSAAKKVLG
ncbi:MAG: alanine--glyoxylate aminotransferase family protein [Candidatus Omnitrophica bacterium]|nr:alanine--glyoxylate aminotransferase family protein [Candidatus Omnitrophota bacterium]HOX54649.1 alanine--glyoxylate aminotransferase family protein [Candidatus Omnitrophota bacterium]